MTQQFDRPAFGARGLCGSGQIGDGQRPEGKPEDIREQYEHQLKVLQEAYGKAMLELQAWLGG